MNRRTLRTLAWLVPVLVCHAPSFRWRFLDGDEGTYAAVAALMNEGGHLYRDGGVDNKFPGIYWVYATVFRLCGRYSMHAVHALALVVVLATCFVLARSAARMGGPRAAWLCALFYGVFTSVYYPKM